MGPLGHGEINSNEIKIIADKYNKTLAQICLRWNYQNGFISIPKTNSINRMKENLDFLDFVIDEYDMSIIDNLPFCGGEGAIVK